MSSGFEMLAARSSEAATASQGAAPGAAKAPVTMQLLQPAHGADIESDVLEDLLRHGSSHFLTRWHIVTLPPLRHKRIAHTIVGMNRRNLSIGPAILRVRGCPAIESNLGTIRCVR